MPRVGITGACLQGRLWRPPSSGLTTRFFGIVDIWDDETDEAQRLMRRRLT
jgi:hypothetical protein